MEDVYIFYGFHLKLNLNIMNRFNRIVNHALVQFEMCHFSLNSVDYYNVTFQFEVNFAPYNAERFCVGFCVRHGNEEHHIDYGGFFRNDQSLANSNNQRKCR